jgi:hypothetical protein
MPFGFRVAKKTDLTYNFPENRVFSQSGEVPPVAPTDQSQAYNFTGRAVQWKKNIAFLLSKIISCFAKA